MKNQISSVSLQVEEIRLTFRKAGEFSQLCHACKEFLPDNTITAEGFYRTTDKYHFECVKVENQNDIVYRDVKVKVKRKSRRYPNGIRHIDFIGTPSDLTGYIKEIEAAGYKVIGVL